MLHIIGLILKCIGIVLLVILGILVLLVCSVLFSRLRYRFRASCDGKLDSLRADLSVFWFFHLVRAEVHMAGTSVSYVVKVAWKRFAASEDIQDNIPMAEETVREDAESDREDAESDRENAESDRVNMGHGTGTPGKAVEMPAERTLEISKNTETAEKQQSFRKKQQSLRKKQGIIRKAAQKIHAWYEKIKYTFQKICDNIRVLLQKKETLAEFIEDPVHRLAFGKVLDEMFRFLKRFRPDKLSAELVFGFEDPCLTGKALAFFGMMYPFWGNSVSITPDFEQRILKGKVLAKGHFRASYLVAAGIRLLLHKPTRTTIGHIRRFKW